jgi:hypothetical protein
LLQFPEEIVAEHADLFFISLVQALSNRQESLVLELACVALKTLLKRVSTAVHARLHGMLVMWSAQPNANLRRAAFQTAGLWSEALGAVYTGPHGLFAALLPKMIDVVDSSVDDVDAASDSFPAENESETSVHVATHWDLLYTAIKSLEKALSADKDLLERLAHLESSELAGAGGGATAVAPVVAVDAAPSKKKVKQVAAPVAAGSPLCRLLWEAVTVRYSFLNNYRYFSSNPVVTEAHAALAQLGAPSG